MSTKLTDKQVSEIIEPFGFKLIKYQDNKNVFVICPCGNEHHKMTLSDIKKGKKCAKCKSIRIKEKYTNSSFLPTDTSDEKWIKYFDRWLSSKGKIYNLLGQEILLDYARHTKINGNDYSIEKHMAIAFKLPNYEYLLEKFSRDKNGDTYVVHRKDCNNDNLDLNNLEIITKSESVMIWKIHNNTNKDKNTDKVNNKKVFEQTEQQNINLDECCSAIINEFENFTFYSNGTIKNGDNIIDGNIDKVEGYVVVGKEKHKFKKHRLICMAFHPIEGKTKYDDYNDLQVNHKDGNPQNNAADNLEWCTQSENQLHKNQSITKGNQQVNMYDGNTDELLKEFVSISEAARFLYDEEYGKFVATDNEEELEKYRKKCNCLQTKIRSRASGKSAQSGKYVWKFADEEKRKKFQEKYAKHV